MSVRFALLAYAALAVALWPVPLLNRLHAESSAVIAGVAFFVSGTAAVAAFRAGRPFGRMLARHGAALVVPAALLLAAMPWAPNCGWRQGLALYALFAPPSVVLAVALAYALTGGAGVRAPRAVLVGTGLAVALGGVAFDLGLHPQVYTYNHVFGGVLGPIYDEELALRPGLVVFRAMTLGWAGLLALFGAWRRGRWTPRRRGMLLALVLALGAAYALRAPLGVNTPAWWLRQQLGGHVRTAHVDLYYDPATLDARRVRHLAEEHEWHLARLGTRLGLSEADLRAEGRIQSYLYPSPDVKAQLTGARTTSVAPVWLPRPQTHLLADRVEASLAHELAHAVSRPYGLPGLKASWAVGLVEGWAVALEPPDGRPSPHAQVAVAAQRRPGGFDALAGDVAARLTPQGFWAGRGAVSYTTTGSFVRYLLDAYGPARLKAVYARADFARVYGRPVEDLAAEWVAFLRAQRLVPRATEALVSRRFSRPSLFERRCPHFVPPPRRAVRRGAAALAAGDTARAAAAFAEALRLEPRYERAHEAVARLRLMRDQGAEAAAHLDTLARDTSGVMSPLLHIRLAQAKTLLGKAEASRMQYDAALAAWPPYAEAGRAQVLLLRRLAAHPAAVRVLVSGDSAHVQAAALTRLVETERREANAVAAVHGWAALRWTQAGRPARAAEAWAAVRRALVADASTARPLADRPLADRLLLRDYAHAAHARAAVHAARTPAAYAAARRLARAAEAALHAAGDTDGAAVMRTLRARAAWAARHRPAAAAAHARP